MHLNFPGSLSSLFRLQQAETWHAPWRQRCNSLLNSSLLIFLEARQHGEAVYLTLVDPAMQTPAAPTDFGWSQSYLQHFPKIRPCALPVLFEHQASLEALGMPSLLFAEASKAPPDLREGNGGQDGDNAWMQLLFPLCEASALGCLLHFLLHPAGYPKRSVPAPLLCSCHPCTNYSPPCLGPGSAPLENLPLFPNLEKVLGERNGNILHFPDSPPTTA